MRKYAATVLAVASVLLVVPSSSVAKEGCTTKACFARTCKSRTCHLRVEWKRITPGERAWLNRTGNCESHGFYGAVSPNGRYRGKYQFDFPTWRSIGGWGDPARASRIEQDVMAIRLLRSAGNGRWPICGH